MSCQSGNASAGHTSQYGTLARALGYAAGLMEDDVEEATDVGQPISAASLRMEARFVTVTLLAAALAECLANTILAIATHGQYAKQQRQRPTLFNRWQKLIPDAIGCNPFLSAELREDLTKLSDVRNSITHANPRLYLGDEVLEDGNTTRWEQLDIALVRMFVGLPLRLVTAVPQTEKYQWPIHYFAEDYWLAQAIARGKGQRGRSYNMWRPETREARLREIQEKRLT